LALSLDPRIGTELVGYRIDAVLGRGGMGVVYRAYDVSLKRNVALKLLAPDLAQDERFRERFLSETELAASLEHPNVVPIHAAGEVEGQLFLAMRYVEGRDLKKVLQEAGALAPARALAVCSQVAAALDAAHERGLVHRDVKPSNVLLDAREHVYLADFGLTRRLEEQSLRVGEGLSLGTPSYAAPEQIRGEPVDGRADVYSLGCLLFECLTGAVPFEGGRALAVLWAHLNDPPPSASERRHELPASLDPVLARAMAKDPEDRYSTCAELVDAARAAVPGLEAAAGGRSRRQVGLIASAVVLAAAALAAGLLLSRGGGTGGRLLGSPADSVQRIDRSSNRLVATVALNGQPKGVAAGQGAVWVASYQNRSETQAVSRVDPVTSAVTRTYDARAGFVTGIAAGEGAVWAIYNRRGPNPHAQLTPYTADATGFDSIQRLDPRRGAFSPAARYRYGFESVAAGQGAVWALTAAGALWRIDPGGGKTVEIPPPSTFPTHSGLVAVGEGGVWVVHGPPDCKPPLQWGLAPDCAGVLLTHVDPATNRAVGTFRIPFEPAGIAVGDGAVWLTDGAHDSVLRLDSRTGLVRKTIGVGRDPVGLAVGADAVWVANSADASVSRIDPKSNRVVAKVDVGGRPLEVALGRGSAWVGVAGPY
jgi:YVTN family beta-propeller protein